MTNLHIKPAMRYQWNYMWRAGLWVAAILIGIILLINVIAAVIYISYANIPVTGDIGYALNEAFGSMRISIIDIGGIFTLMLFIVGIFTIREDLRFFIQHGMGRKTTYVANILISLITAAAAGLFSELLALLVNNVEFLHGSISGFPTDNFFASWLLHTLSLFFAWHLGTMISLIYYRLNTLGKVLFSVTAGALFLFIIPVSLAPFVDFIFPASGPAVFNLLTNPALLGLITFGLTAVCAIISFLLIRRATIKSAS